MRYFSKPLQTFLTGVLVVLPLMLTAAAIIYVGNLLLRMAGPGSTIGRLLVLIGMKFAANSMAAYLLGFVVVVLCIYLLGLLVQLGLRSRLESLVDRFVRRLPLVGSIYDVTNRFVGLLERKEKTDLKTMSPVWCFFGGVGGTAVLALLPSADPVVLNGQRYNVILVPSAPVPFGGALIYVPAEWVKPAPFGVEALINIYVSMGISLPKGSEGKTPSELKRSD